MCRCLSIYFSRMKIRTLDKKISNPVYTHSSHAVVFSQSLCSSPVLPSLHLRRVDTALYSPESSGPVRKTRFCYCKVLRKEGMMYSASMLGTWPHSGTCDVTTLSYKSHQTGEQESRVGRGGRWCREKHIFMCIASRAMSSLCARSVSLKGKGGWRAPASLSVCRVLMLALGQEVRGMFVACI